MKKILLIMIGVFAMLQLWSQDYPYYSPMYSRGYQPHIGAGLNNYVPGTEDDKKLDVNVQLGTSFATNFNRGFAFTTFVAPELRYRVSERFTLRGGISMSYNQYGNTLLYSPYGASEYSGNFGQGMIYVSGDYLLSPKLILSGTAYKEFSVNQGLPENGFNPGFDGKGLMMNLRFMPSENVTIDAGVEIYEGNNPYRNGLYNPYRPFGTRW